MSADRDELEVYKHRIAEASADPDVCEIRLSLAKYAAATFADAGEKLLISGHIFGTDRVEGKSPFGHGNDEAVGVSILLRIASQLTAASAALFEQSLPYAAAALLRQLVEVEYLAWAFEVRDQDAQTWLRSDKATRETFFRPAKLRAAADGKFRSKDYGYHCEMGGHPVPQATILLRGESWATQLFLSDLLGHSGRTWDHLIGWASNHQPHGSILLKFAPEMLRRFKAWKACDALCDLPPPP